MLGAPPSRRVVLNKRCDVRGLRTQNSNVNVKGGGDIDLENCAQWLRKREGDKVFSYGGVRGNYPGEKSRCSPS